MATISDFQVSPVPVRISGTMHLESGPRLPIVDRRSPVLPRRSANPAACTLNSPTPLRRPVLCVIRSTLPAASPECRHPGAALRCALLGASRLRSIPGSFNRFRQGLSSSSSSTTYAPNVPSENLTIKPSSPSFSTVSIRMSASMATDYPSAKMQDVQLCSLTRCLPLQFSNTGRQEGDVLQAAKNVCHSPPNV